MRFPGAFNRSASGHVAILFAATGMALAMRVAFAMHGAAILNPRAALQDRCRPQRGTLTPGLYILKGDGLHVAGNSPLELTAPATGLTAGFLMLEDPANPAGNIHVIASNFARYMVGPIHFPNGILRVDTKQNVSDRSEYTALTASRLQTLGDSNLYLNTDHDLTDGPVPKGVGPVGEKMRLVN